MMQNGQLPQPNNGRYTAQSVPDQRSLRGGAPGYYAATGGWTGQSQNQAPVRRRPTQRVYLNKSQVKHLLIFLAFLAITVTVVVFVLKNRENEKDEALKPYAHVFLPNVSVDGVNDHTLITSLITQ